MKTLMLCFAAGGIGALANSIVVWAFGHYGLSQSMGVAIAPALSAAWLYPRIVWGGLWGFLFALPLSNARPLTKAALLSLFPTAFQLFVVFPYFKGLGVAGMALGELTPVLVLFFNWVWAVATMMALRLAR
ncbi:hypothetical protein L1F30_02495 [Simiduia sp. 21SJ11W-1]|uniref:hypothetical protein n=1 Tax=Simiduia sp. 21SJ11W-1 TaxID=2909669 RepID=UPI00209D201B|nr:hypothetical protein [Simiduia sp. 21SJ11W-1]UTA48426.1 hypothetical protein L1F30_02495 [Simiduia sp. 21SJ11W-1]